MLVELKVVAYLLLIDKYQISMYQDKRCKESMLIMKVNLPIKGRKSCLIKSSLVRLTLSTSSQIPGARSLIITHKEANSLALTMQHLRSPHKWRLVALHIRTCPLSMVVSSKSSIRTFKVNKVDSNNHPQLGLQQLSIEGLIAECKIQKRFI